MSKEIYTKLDCQFCVPTGWDHFEQFGVDPNLPNTALAETDSLYARADILPNAPLHFVAMPKFHGIYASIQAPELAHEYGQLRYKLERDYGPMIVAEHGDLGEETTASTMSVRHQHTHFFGGLGDIDAIRYFSDMLSGGLDGVSYDYQTRTAPRFPHQSNIPPEGREMPYLYVEQGNRGIWLPDPEDLLKSQTTQRSIHQLHSGEQLSWKEIQDREDLAKLSCQRVLEMIDRCKE